MSYPLLKTGSRGPDVLRLKGLLVARGLHRSTDDDTFYKATADIVADYQRATIYEGRLLSETETPGEVGQGTWESLAGPVPAPPVPIKPVPRLPTGQVQTLLEEQGFDPGPVDGIDGPRTQAALTAFQFSHLGPDRQPLKASGVLDDATTWALLNPSGSAQKLGLQPVETGIRRTDRDRVLKLCGEWHRKGLKEIPDGSNTGDGVTQFHKFFGMDPAAWCAMAATKVVHDATGSIPWGKKIALVSALRNHCRKHSKTKVLGIGVRPTPGDLFVMVHANGTGHIGVVAGVSKDGRWLDVYEGNSGNRWALRRRAVGAGDHVGYINWVGDWDDPPYYPPGLAAVAESGDASTR